MELSLVLPCYNEADNIENTVKDVLAWFADAQIDGEIIIVDDGSTDGSGEIIDHLADEHESLRVVHHEVNKGYGSALKTGLNEARKDWMGYMDSDGQFHAPDFNKLFPYTQQVDFVTGRRFKRADPAIRKLNAKLFGILNVLILGIWVRDINCAVKLWRRNLWPKIRPQYATGALFNAEMFFHMKKQGIAWKQVFVDHYPRKHGEQTGAKLSVILRMFVDLVRLRLKGISSTPSPSSTGGGEQV